MRFDSQLSRMNCQRFSTGLSSGHLGGSGMRVMLGGTMSSADAGLVLPPQLYARSLWELPLDLRQTGGEAFLKSAIAPSFWPRWRGRAESLR